MLDKKVKINDRVLFILFLIFPMIKCDEKAVGIWLGSQIAGAIKNILVLWNLFSLMVILILFLYKIRRYGIQFVKIYTWLAIILFMVFTISTIMCRNIGIYNIIRSIGNIAAVFMLVNTLCDEDYMVCLQGFYYYLTAIMVVAALTIYLFQPAYTNSNGSAYYLYGLDNVTFLYSMNGFFAGMIYYLSKDGKLKWPFLLTYLFIGGAYVYTGTGTGTVIFLLCILFVIFYRNQWLNLLNYKMVLSLCALIFVFLVLVQNLSAFSGLLGLIGKDTTMSGRTILWSAAFREFPKHMLMGIGISTSLLGEILVSQGVSWGTGIGHLHNVLMEYLFRGGIVNLTVFILMWLGCYKTVRRSEKKVLGNCFLCMVLIQFLAYMFEYRLEDISYWILLMSGYHLSYLTDCMETALSENPQVQNDELEADAGEKKENHRICIFLGKIWKRFRG